ncbi:integrase core domain-containing protein [Secundilactobacillus kimchicus]|uniref:integrase core domain-containing protein n=1 Tax=Secundilactobacillus kimchicus TaxID=528209 RepID=UPI0012E3EC4C
MSRKGNCHDNALIESFFNLLKRECLNRIRIENLSELVTAVTDTSISLITNGSQ